SFIDAATTKSYPSYQGGGLDFFGIDDGTRKLPGNLPPDITKLTILQADSFSRSEPFPNIWKVENKKAPINQSFALSYGDKFTVFNNDFGIISSLSYKNNFTKNGSKQGLPSIVDVSGIESDHSVLWGALLKLGYKLSDLNKVSFLNSYTINSNDEVFQLNGVDLYRGNDVRKTGLRFVQRSLYNGQISGDSYLPIFKGIQLEWRGSYSKTVREEPDYRRYSYEKGIEEPDSVPYRMYIPIGPNLDAGSRFFSTLKENTRNYGIDISIPLGFSSIKAGGSYQKADRSFNSRLFNIIHPGATTYRNAYYAIDSIFDNKFFGGRSLQYSEYISGTNRYTSGDEIAAYYGMIDVPFSILDQEFRIITGARVENSLLRLRSMDATFLYPIIVNRLDNDLLPSVNLIYKLSEAANLRLSYSNTINHPEFREVAPFNYYDFQTQTNLIGNPNLRTAKIRNYDIRFEVYPDIGELLSFSIFYKRIQDAIEKVVIDVSSGEASSFTNAQLAKNYGYEIETRASLGYLLKDLSDFSISLNYSYIKSEIDNVLGGKSIGKKRPLQGQSPYIINLSVNYTSNNLGTSATLLYNRIGRRITEVASQVLNDIYEEPNDLIDFVATQRLTENVNLKFTAKNILAKDNIQTIEGKIVRSRGSHTTYSIGVSFSL
ncbi:MAG TPA: TonB-dependent receptor, partial [Ignavibacteriaceae bacterium]|nr:TonB-dependent receptor [Ignavibacteriaceae bacterium]